MNNGQDATSQSEQRLESFENSMDLKLPGNGEKLSHVALDVRSGPICYLIGPD